VSEEAHELVGLRALSKALRLSVRWLRAEALANRLPHLKVGRKYLFTVAAVRTALAGRVTGCFPDEPLPPEAPNPDGWLVAARDAEGRVLASERFLCRDYPDARERAAAHTAQLATRFSDCVVTLSPFVLSGPDTAAPVCLPSGID
jgi:hypothetical protein